MLNYTKGEWKPHSASLSSDYVVTGNRNVCRVLNTGDMEMLKANAQLISASPDLYEALKDALEAVRKNGVVDHRQIEQALAKAEGK